MRGPKDPSGSRGRIGVQSEYIIDEEIIQIKIIRNLTWRMCEGEQKRKRKTRTDFYRETSEDVYRAETESLLMLSDGTFLLSLIFFFSLSSLLFSYRYQFCFGLARSCATFQSLRAACLFCNAKRPRKLLLLAALLVWCGRNYLTNPAQFRPERNFFTFLFFFLIHSHRLDLSCRSPRRRLWDQKDKWEDGRDDKKEELYRLSRADCTTVEMPLPSSSRCGIYRTSSFLHSRRRESEIEREDPSPHSLLASLFSCGLLYSARNSERETDENGDWQLASSEFLGWETGKKSFYTSFYGPSTFIKRQPQRPEGQSGHRSTSTQICFFFFIFFVSLYKAIKIPFGW